MKVHEENFEYTPNGHFCYSGHQNNDYRDRIYNYKDIPSCLYVTSHNFMVVLLNHSEKFKILFLHETILFLRFPIYRLILCIWLCAHCNNVRATHDKTSGR